MKITAIKQQVKRSDRYSVFVEGKYSFSLSESGLLKTGLTNGQDINENDLSLLRNEALIDKAKTKAFDLLSRRPRSKWELEDYLGRKGYETEIIESTLNMLSNLGYVNDSDFAKRWISDRRLLKSTSKRRLTQELRQKKVPDDIIKEALSTDDTDEREVLKDLIARKRRQSRYQDNTKLIQYLARQGFNYDAIKEVLDEIA